MSETAFVSQHFNKQMRGINLGYHTKVMLWHIEVSGDLGATLSVLLVSVL